MDMRKCAYTNTCTFACACLCMDAHVYANAHTHISPLLLRKEASPALPLLSRSPANSLQQKLYNWCTLDSKVFRKLGFQLPKEQQNL